MTEFLIDLIVTSTMEYKATAKLKRGKSSLILGLSKTLLS
jgi:hypothetical protein